MRTSFGFTPEALGRIKFADMTVIMDIIHRLVVTHDRQEDLDLELNLVHIGLVKLLL
jgi:hypothetical protein